MGQKWSVTKENYVVHYAEYSVQGLRNEMEDAFIADLNFGKQFSKVAKKKSMNVTIDNSGALFGVFDGHTGARCSEYVSKNLPRILFEKDSFPNDIPKALSEAFLTTDQSWLKLAKAKHYQDGSTGIIVYLDGNHLYVANAGDSRGIMCEDGQLVELSTDHKPALESERLRIEANGGKVTKGRINGNLAVSRGFGDLQYKNEETLGEKLVTVQPDVRKLDITSKTSFILLACDGLWDTVSNPQALDFVKLKLIELSGKPLSPDNRELYVICVELVRLAYDQKSGDNISCILILLEHK